MKYGESTFDIIYLIFGLVMGILILSRKKDTAGRLMGTSILVLVCGDAFHLIPRVLNYFTDSELTAWLGIGKFVTSITMTVFYVLLYHLWIRLYKETPGRALSVAVYVLFAVRVILCLLPQNGWLSNEGSVLWGIIRNIPFVALGVLVICLFFKKRREISTFRCVWLLIIFSFLFYIPVAVLASIVPMLGMLMLPKTVCYMILFWIFWRYARLSAGNSENSAVAG